MDNITHSLVGALIGQAGLKRRTGLAMPALIIGANLPDIDAACLFWLDGVQHLAFRRGITHGPIAWVLLPLLLAGALWWFDRWQARRGTRPEGRLLVRFGWLYALAFIACLTHPALDWLNVYGVRLLEPFSSRWFYGDVLFIIDVWLWALMGFATWFSLRREKRGGEWRRPAQIAIAISCLYALANGILTGVAERQGMHLVRQAYGFDPTLVVASPPPLTFWKRDILWRLDHPTEFGAFEGRAEFSAGNPARLSRSMVGLHVLTYEGPVAPPADDDGRHRDAMFTLTAPQLDCLTSSNPDLRDYLTWSRMPLFDPLHESKFKSVTFRDQRYATDRFTVIAEMPSDRCEPAE